MKMTLQYLYFFNNFQNKHFYSLFFEECDSEYRFTLFPYVSDF